MMTRTALTSIGAVGAAMSATLVLAACGATENGPVIGAPPATHLSVGSASSSDALAAFQRSLSDQLGQASATRGSGHRTSNSFGSRLGGR